MVQSDPKMIKEIVDAVTIPVMAKVRIGHFVEAQVCLSGTLMPTQIFSQLFHPSLDPAIDWYRLYRRVRSTHPCG